jgi:septum formation protein
MRTPPLIVASASPRRAELLRQLGLDFQVLPAKAEEIQPGHLSPHEVAQVNAYRKARMVAKKHPDSVVLAADTLVCLGMTLFGKPAHRADAVRMLMELQGRTHAVVTGVCLLHLRLHRQRLFAESTAVTFHSLEESAVKHYLTRIDPLDKAGAYAIQEHGELIVANVSGSFSNVIGLPLERVREELAVFGLDVRPGA